MSHALKLRMERLDCPLAAAGVTGACQRALRKEKTLSVRSRPRTSRNIQMAGAWLSIHGAHDHESTHVPFSEQLPGWIPQPEPWYVIGDLHVRLQGRLSHETDILGPHIFVKAASPTNWAKTLGPPNTAFDRAGAQATLYSSFAVWQTGHAASTARCTFCSLTGNKPLIH